MRALIVLLAASSGPLQANPELPQRLTDTGLYTGDGLKVRPQNIPYSPQYPLWSDGASKRRWLYLPPGSYIDASKPDAWEFPRGTRIWKQFGYDRPVETRYIERRHDGSWRFATYAWNADGRDASLVTAGGAMVALPAAPGGRYEIPARADCLACHEGGAVPVLGIESLQLSPDRDPNAAHAEPARPGDADLRELVARGKLRNLPGALLANPPRIPAATAGGRAALGYLHANCGHCHNASGPLAALELELAQDVVDAAGSRMRTLQSLLAVSGRFHPAGAAAGATRAQSGVLPARMRSRDPLVQMPPLGTRLVDADGLALIEQWIQNELPTSQELNP